MNAFTFKFDLIMAKGFTVKAKTPVTTPKPAEWGLR